MSSSPFQRRPYTGSCHCGLVKYIVYLSLPTLPYPRTTQTEYRAAGGHRIYRCNCTICHKSSLMHIRVLDPANDFFIVTPEEPFSEGSGFKRYVPQGATYSWDFCERCGVRPFSARGEGYMDRVEFPTRLIQRLNSRTCDGSTGPITAREEEVTRISVWRPSKDWREAGDEEDSGENYCSVNAATLDAHNENFDMRQLHQQGYVAYMQTLQEVGYDYQDVPYFGGMY